MPLAHRTLPVATFGGGIGGTGILSLPGVEAHLIHIDKGTVTGAEDGTRQNPFHTVAAGLVAAAALVPTALSPVMLLIYPGEYSEDGLGSVDYCSWVGVGGRESVRIEGDDAVVLTVDDEHTSYWGITFAQASAATSILQVNTGIDDPRVEFHECAFEGLGATDQPVEVQDGGVYFKDCHLVHADQTQLILAVVNSANNDVVIEGCDDIVGVLDLNGGLFRMEHSRVLGEDITAVIQIANVGTVEMRHCQVTAVDGDCVQFTAQPNEAVFQSNRFWSASPCYDLNATLAVTGFRVEGNHMWRGIAGNISHVGAERRVGDVAAGNTDFYSTVQAALDSCTFDDIVVRLLDDKVLGAALVWNKALRVTIDGNGFHALNRGNAQILVFGAGAYSGRHLVFRDLDVTGYFTEATSVGTTQSVRVERCEWTGQLIVGTGSLFTLEVIRSRIVGVAVANMARPIFVNAVASTILVKRSYLKGAAGFPAVYYTQINDNVKIEHSTIWHGSGGANSPIARSAAQTPDYCSHHDSYNTDPLAAGWLTNLIAVAQRFNSYDVQTDY